MTPGEYGNLYQNWAPARFNPHLNLLQHLGSSASHLCSGLRFSWEAGRPGSKSGAAAHPSSVCLSLAISKTGRITLLHGVIAKSNEIAHVKFSTPNFANMGLVQSCRDPGKIMKIFRNFHPLYFPLHTVISYPPRLIYCCLPTFKHPWTKQIFTVASLCATYREMFRRLFWSPQWLNLRLAKCSIIIQPTMCIFPLSHSLPELLSHLITSGRSRSRIGWWFELITLLSWIRQNEKSCGLYGGNNVRIKGDVDKCSLSYNLVGKWHFLNKLP